MYHSETTLRLHIYFKYNRQCPPCLTRQQRLSCDAETNKLSSDSAKLVDICESEATVTTTVRSGGDWSQVVGYVLMCFAGICPNSQ
jgi:hypothetical protein